MKLIRYAVFAIGILAISSVSAQQRKIKPPRVAHLEVFWNTPAAQCGNGGGAIVEVSSYTGKPSYQPQQDLCIRITDTNGALVPGSPSPGYPYTTPEFASPPLSLAAGAAYTVEIVYCSTGGHAFPLSTTMPNPFPYANATLTAPNCRKGMTWGKYGDSDPVSGVLRVGCQPNGSGGVGCNPYTGDTACSVQLPMLCRKSLSLPKPASYTGSRWSGNVVATTPPVSPDSAALNTRADADAYCAAQFGNDPSWKVASFHDGGGWNFAAYGNTGIQNDRFWVDIVDQPNGNCWVP